MILTNENLKQIIEENPQLNDLEETIETLDDLVEVINDWEDLIDKSDFEYQILEQIKARTIYDFEQRKNSKYIDVSDLDYYSISETNLYAGMVSVKPIKFNNQEVYIFKDRDGQYNTVNDIVSFKKKYNNENELRGLDYYSDDCGKDLINDVANEFLNLKYSLHGLSFLEEGEILEKYADLATDYAKEITTRKYCDRRGIRRDALPDEYEWENKWRELLIPAYEDGLIAFSINEVEEQYNIDIVDDIQEFYDYEILPMVNEVRSDWEDVFDKYLDVYGENGISLRNLNIVDFCEFSKKTLECWCDNNRDFISDVKDCLFVDIVEGYISNDITSKEEFTQEMKDFWNNASDDDKYQFEKNVKLLKNDIEVLEKYPLGDFSKLDNFYWTLADKINDKLEIQLDQDYDYVKEMIKVEDREELRDLILQRYNENNYMIDVSDLDVSNVKDMSEMFRGCNNLQEIKGLENWNVSNVEDMDFMFLGCKNLKDISSLSDWDVSNVVCMYGMFWGCKNLEDISSLSDWDVFNVKYMEDMFEGTKIEYLNLFELKKIDKNNCFTVQDLKTGSNKLKRLSELDNYQIYADDNVQIDVYIDDVKKFHYKYENERDVIHFNQETKEISTDKGIKPLKGLDKDPDKTL